MPTPSRGHGTRRPLLRLTREHSSVRVALRLLPRAAVLNRPQHFRLPLCERRGSRRHFSAAAAPKKLAPDGPHPFLIALHERVATADNL